MRDAWPLRSACHGGEPTTGPAPLKRAPTTLRRAGRYRKRSAACPRGDPRSVAPRSSRGGRADCEMCAAAQDESRDPCAGQREERRAVARDATDPHTPRRRAPAKTRRRGRPRPGSVRSSVLLEPLDRSDHLLDRARPQDIEVEQPCIAQGLVRLTSSELSIDRVAQEHLEVVHDEEARGAHLRVPLVESVRAPENTVRGCGIAGEPGSRDPCVALTGVHRGS